MLKFMFADDTIPRHKHYRGHNKFRLSAPVNIVYRKLSINVDKTTFIFLAKVKSVHIELMFQFIMLKYLKHMLQNF